MYKYFPQRGDQARTAYNVQKAVTTEDMGTNVPRIYAALDNKHDKF
jgi:hypothetical protein